MTPMTLYDLLSGIGAVSQSSWEKQFHRHNQKHADGCGGNDLDEKGEKGTELQPLEHYEVAMVQQGKYECIDKIRTPTHAPRRWLVESDLCGFFGDQQVDDKGSYISNEHTGSGMQARRHGKIIKRQTSDKANTE